VEARDGRHLGPFEAAEGLEVGLEELVESIAGGNWNELASHLYKLLNIITPVIVQSYSATITSLNLYHCFIKNWIIFWPSSISDYPLFMTILKWFYYNFLNVKALSISPRYNTKVHCYVMNDYSSVSHQTVWLLSHSL
jgi:hypothetical protein